MASRSRTRSDAKSPAPRPKREQNREQSRSTAKGNAKHVSAKASAKRSDAKANAKGSAAKANVKVKASTKVAKNSKVAKTAKPKGKGSSILGAILFVPSAIAGLFKRGSANSSQHTFSSQRRFASMSPRKVAVLSVLLVLALGVALVYPAARNYYVSVRTYDRSQAELAAIYDRNAQLQERIDTLKTKAGMEDYVRAQYGWTKSKENAVRVTGLPSSTSKFELPANIPAGSVVAEDSVLNNVLDAIFFVKDDVPTASDTTLANSTKNQKAAEETTENETAKGETTASEGSADEQPAA